MWLQVGAGRTEKVAIVDVRQRGDNRWNKTLKDDAGWWEGERPMALERGWRISLR